MCVTWCGFSSHSNFKRTNISPYAFPQHIKKVTKNYCILCFLSISFLVFCRCCYVRARALFRLLCRITSNSHHIRRAVFNHCEFAPTGPGHTQIDNVTKTSRSLFNSWRSGGALSGTSSNNHTNHFSDYSSFHTTTSTQIMATSSGIFKDCTHISFSDTIKSHNNVTFKLVKTGK